MKLALITVKEVKEYFKPYNPFDINNDYYDDVNGKDSYITYYIKPEQILYKYEVKSLVDPIDSASDVTDSPVDAIDRFVNFHEREKNIKDKPSTISSTLLFLASDIMKNKNIYETRNKLDMLHASLIGSTRLSSVNINDEFIYIRKELLNMGWSVKRTDDRILANLIGRFEAEIEIDDILYDCKFLIYDHTSYRRDDESYNRLIEENFLTNDPIGAYIKFHNRKDVKKIKEQTNYDDFTEYNLGNDFAYEIQNDPSERELKELSKVLPSDRYTNLTYPDHEELHGIETKRSGNHMTNF